MVRLVYTALIRVAGEHFITGILDSEGKKSALFDGVTAVDQAALDAQPVSCEHRFCRCLSHGRQKREQTACRLLPEHNRLLCCFRHARPYRRSGILSRGQQKLPQRNDRRLYRCRQFPGSFRCNGHHIGNPHCSEEKRKRIFTEPESRRTGSSEVPARLQRSSRSRPKRRQESSPRLRCLGIIFCR